MANLAIHMQITSDSISLGGRYNILCLFCLPFVDIELIGKIRYKICRRSYLDKGIVPNWLVKVTCVPMYVPILAPFPVPFHF